MALLELKNISAGYGKNTILDNFNLNVEKGNLVSLLGPSGCGKTTTLRLIAGFLEANRGKFIFNNKEYTKIPVSKRNFGFVFQNYALFPHLTIFENVAFGLKLRKISGKELEKKVHNILEVVDLKGYEKRYPKELSGGQRQRVALARALVINPDLLLFDEPLSNLDAKLRVKMRVEIRKIQQELGITAIYVTHDQEECFSISDKVAIMNKGIIEQLGSPEEIYKYPTTEFVAKFVGVENFIDLHCIKKEEKESLYKTKDGILFKALNQNNNLESENIRAAIRPEDIKLLNDQEGNLKENNIKGNISVSTFLGKQYQHLVETKLGDFIVNSSLEANFKVGENVILNFPKEKIILVK